MVEEADEFKFLRGQVIGLERSLTYRSRGESLLKPQFHGCGENLRLPCPRKAPEEAAKGSPASRKEENRKGDIFRVSNSRCQVTLLQHLMW